MKSQNLKTKNQSPQTKNRKPIQLQTIERLKMRPVSSPDNEFLREVYAASREVELALLPWNAAQKRAFVENQLQAQTLYYETEYPTATHDIILFDNIAVGRIYVWRDEKEIFILDIAVLPVHRKNGIATALIKELQEESAQSNKLIKIYIEAFNHSQNLFKNLGFELKEDDGLNLLFEWNPQKSSVPNH